MNITKIGEAQIPEINTRNPEITKRGRPITNGSMKTHQHVYHKRNAIPWSLTIKPVQRRSAITVRPRNPKLKYFETTT